MSQTLQFLRCGHLSTKSLTTLRTGERENQRTSRRRTHKYQVIPVSYNGIDHGCHLFPDSGQRVDQNPPEDKLPDLNFQEGTLGVCRCRVPDFRVDLRVTWRGRVGSLTRSRVSLSSPTRSSHDMTSVYLGVGTRDKTPSHLTTSFPT